MIFLSEKSKVLSWNFLQLKLKYNNILKNLCFSGIFGFSSIFLNLRKILDFNFLKSKFNFSWFELNCGWLSLLYLNGLGFKSTRKIFNINKKYWRFNVGHSHVFQYFTPRNVIMKIKQRFVFFFGLNKSQIFDIAKKIKSFHMPDSYKGVGIKYPNEFIRLKKGKIRQ